MEFITSSYIREENQCQITELNIHGETLDSERCDSVELNLDITRQIHKNINKSEEALLVSRTQTLYEKNLCHHEMLTQCFIQSGNPNNMSTKAYKERIQNLEQQKAEILDVNKQWDNQFRNMKKIYEKKIAELRMKLSLYERSTREEYKALRKDEHQHYWKDQHTQQSQKMLPLEIQNIAEENWLLRKQNYVLYKRMEYYKGERDHLSKALVKATQKTEDAKTQTRLHVSARNLDYEDLRAEIDVLLHQIKIYEEDFREERADKEKLCQEKEELQHTNQKLKLQIQTNTKIKL